MDSYELIEKLKKIDSSEYENEVLVQRDAWIKEIEELEALKALSENFLIKEMMTRYGKMIEDMDSVLLNKRELKESERLNILDKKALYKDFIQSFDADAKLARIGEQIEQL